MIETINNYAETTNFIGNMCALSDALKSMRVSGSVLINEEYMPPWGVMIPDTAKLQIILKLSKDVRVMAFHFVKRGYIEVAPDGGEPLTIEAGEMAICFGGLAHRLSQGAIKKTIPVESLLTGGTNPFQPEESTQVRSTSLMCGVFMMRNVELNPLFLSLPSMLHVSALRSSSFHNLPGVLGWMNHEAEKMPQCTFVLERLLELLCAEVLRAHMETASPESGWFFGMKDPVVGRAITMIHSRPGDNWSVDRLAQGVAMSSSRFAARFSVALGDSPMAYVTKWRMNVAGRLLEESGQGIGKIAAEVGYENVAAFSRTFKRHLGVTPAAWRSRQR